MTGKERLDQIERGLDGVTATEFEIIAYSSSVEWRKNQLVSAAQYPHVLPKNIVDFDTPLVRLADAESRVRDLEERLAKAAEALEPFNQAALAIRTAERMNRREFQDGDTFVSGVAWKEDDKVRTITFGDFRRARTALSQIRSEK